MSHDPKTPMMESRVCLLIALALWVRESLGVVPSFLRKLLEDPTYYPGPNQVITFRTEECFLRISAAEFITAYRTLSPANEPIASPP
jgi:hypothetical protein